MNSNQRMHEIADMPWAPLIMGAIAGGLRVVAKTIVVVSVSTVLLRLYGVLP